MASTAGRRRQLQAHVRLRTDQRCSDPTRARYMGAATPPPYEEPPLGRQGGPSLGAQQFTAPARHAACTDGSQPRGTTCTGQISVTGRGCSRVVFTTTLWFCFPAQPNGARLSCGALKKDSFLNLRAPSASSAG